MAPKFPVGTKYKRRVSAKVVRICTVTDYHVTRNLAGEVVRVGYVATHEFCGQQIEERDVCETTIARGLIATVDPEQGRGEEFRETCPRCYTPLSPARGGGVICLQQGCGYSFCF